MSSLVLGEEVNKFSNFHQSFFQEFFFINFLYLVVSNLQKQQKLSHSTPETVLKGIAASNGFGMDTQCKYDALADILHSHSHTITHTVSQNVIYKLAS